MTVDRVVARTSEKRALWERIGSVSQAVVDMESRCWATAAQRHGIPFVALRAVSDRSDEALPEWLNDCRRSDGSFDRARIARRLALRPTAVPRLLRMQRRVEGAAVRLAETLEHLLRRRGSEGAAQGPGGLVSS